MYFPAEMLKPMLCMHERLLQEAPCQRGVTNRENFAIMLRTCTHILCLLQGGRGTWSSLPLPRLRHSEQPCGTWLTCVRMGC